MDSKIKLSRRELDVMYVLWEADTPLTAKDIVYKNNSLSINTVQAVLKGLLKKEYIEIAEIVYSGTVLTRNYKPALRIDEYMTKFIKDINKHMSTEGLMVALLKNEKNEEELIEKLESVLKQRREMLEKGKA